MTAQKIILPAITATSVMTVFSYLIAHYEKKNFSESELLGKIEKKQLRLLKQLELPAGWATHYAVGVIMSLMFELYKNNFRTKSTLQQIIIFGTFGGLLGMSAWKLLFKMLPERSYKFYKKFYSQLFVAHLIFAAAVIGVQDILMKAEGR
jgi:hypothetical protein